MREFKHWLCLGFSIGLMGTAACSNENSGNNTGGITAKKGVSKPPGLDGYKSAKWGVSIEKVQKALNVTLGSVHSEIFPAGGGAASRMFWIRWGVPYEYSHDLKSLPPDMLTHKTPDGDFASFRGKKFFAFRIRNLQETREAVLAQLIKKHGRPDKPHYPDVWKWDVSVWDRGATRIFLVTQILEKQDWAVSTDLFYLSATDEDQIIEHVKRYKSGKKEREHSAAARRTTKNLNKVE